MKKNLFNYITIVFINLLFSAQIINFDNTETALYLVNKDNNSIEFDFQLGDILINEININNKDYIELTIPSFHSSNQIGHPKLPEIHELLEIPH